MFGTFSCAFDQNPHGGLPKGITVVFVNCVRRLGPCSRVGRARKLLQSRTSMITPCSLIRDLSKRPVSTPWGMINDTMNGMSSVRVSGKLQVNSPVPVPCDGRNTDGTYRTTYRTVPYLKLKKDMRRRSMSPVPST